MAIRQENSFNYLSDATVRERWVKEDHCHFCRRYCGSQTELKFHLEDQNQDNCSVCYFRHYRTKVRRNICLLIEKSMFVLYFLLSNLKLCVIEIHVPTVRSINPF